MTLAVAGPTLSHPTAPQTVPIVILGTDALLAALPATPVQLAHACLRAGFANVIPASWGDELIAAAVLRRLPRFGNGPAIQCSCPIVAHRLLTVGGDLRPVMLPLVAPPVAIARYVRALARPAHPRITYVGACPGAVDESIDIRMTPDALVAMLAEREIMLEDQPRAFESIIPPDRRRFLSQPGGVPTAEALWSDLGSRTLVEVNSDDYVSEIAQHLLTGKNVLLDTSTRLGCACSGAVGGAHGARAQVIANEPPRSMSTVIDDNPSIDLDLPIPAVPRTPVDVVAVPTTAPSTTHGVSLPPGESPFGNRISPVRATGPIPEARPSRTSSPVVPRPVLSAFPVARDVEGKSLPRAYVARRRPSPRGVSILVPDEPSSETATPPQEPPVHTPPTPSVTAPRAAVTPPPPAAVAPESSPPVIVPLEPKPAPLSIVPEPAHAPALSAAPVEPEGGVATATATPPRPARRVPSPKPEPAAPPRQETWGPPPAPITRGQIVLILLAVAMIAICASTVVGVIVGRSISAGAPSTQQPR